MLPQNSLVVLPFFYLRSSKGYLTFNQLSCLLCNHFMNFNLIQEHVCVVIKERIHNFLHPINEMRVICSQESLTAILKDQQLIAEKSVEIGKDIIDGLNNVNNVVENLGFALTSTDVARRSSATQMLSEVLTNLPVDYLSDTHINFLATFYCDRMKDHHSVVPGVLTGMLAIARMKHTPDGASCRLLQSMFQNISCQSQLRDDREKIFSILKTLSETHVKELLAMSADFVYGVINAIDGERDPRMLLLIFEFIPNFLKTYPLYHLVEEMFEVLACYFPVDFHPSPNDAAAITRDALAQKLATCLCGSPEFATSCIILLLEKMESQLNVAKMDSLHLLSNCAQNFKSEDIETNFHDIWSMLIIEVYPGSDKDLTVAALAALKTIVQSVSYDQTACDNILVKVDETILGSLADVDARLFGPSVAIAMSCASASKYSASRVTNKLLPLFLSQCQANKERTTQYTTVLGIVSQFLTICKELGVLAELDRQSIESAQRIFVDCLSGKNDLFVVGLHSLIDSVDIIIAENRSTVYNIIKEHVNDDKYFAETKRLLFAFAMKYPDEVMTNVIQDITTKAANQTCVGNQIEVLCSIVPIETFTEVAFKFTFDYIFGDSKQSDLRLISLTNLRIVCENDTNGRLLTVLYSQYNIINRLVQLVHDSQLDSDTLMQICEILRLIVKSLSVDEQFIVIKKYLPPMDLNRCGDLYLTAGILGFLDENVQIEDHFENVIGELTKLSLATDDKQIAQLCNHLLCSMFNKMPDTEQNKNVLRRTIDFLKKEIEANNKKAIKIVSWITKGLLVRGHSNAAELIGTLLELLEHPTLANAGSLAFEILAMEFPALHLPLVKQFYKQKLFQLVLAKLFNKLNEYSSHHLVAFTYVLKMTPHAVIQMNLMKIGPILFKCLASDEASSIQIVLDIINRFLLEKNDYFREHLHHLIPSCLTLSTYKTSLKIRIAAVDCLITMVKFPTFVLLPFRQDVLQGLLLPLDDTKRLVRNAAVIARNQWFLLGTE